MKSPATARRTAAAVGAAALLGMGTLGACATKERPAEMQPPSQPAATAPPSPTEKAVAPSPQPGSGPGNSFAPSVKAPAAPTALPGNVITGG